MKWYLICQLPGVTAAALPLLATDSSTLSPALGKECAAAGSSNISAAETKGRKDVGAGGEALFLMELKTVWRLKTILITKQCFLSCT